MSKRIFSDIQQQALSKNINVLNVSNKSITFHPSFKLADAKISYLEAKLEFLKKLKMLEMQVIN